MKRKYAAIALGLAMSMISLNVYGVAASDTQTEDTSGEDATDETSEDTDSTEDAEDSTGDVSESEEETDEAEILQDVVGQVTAVGDDSLTIATGDLVWYESEDSDDTEEDTEASEEAVEELTLELDGQEITYSFDDTSFFLKETDDTLLINVTEAVEEDDAESSDETEIADADTEAEAEEEELEVLDESEVEEIEDEEDDIEIEIIDLADIQVGDIVEVMVDSDGEITVILVQQANPSEDSDDAAEESTAEESDTAESTEAEADAE